VSAGPRGTRGLTAGSAREGAADDQPQARSAAEVLADRLAAELVRHEPGWRLPRRTALARRYDVTLAQLDAAVGELVRRHLVRRQPDRRLYRASPAEYLIPLPAAPGLRSRIDPGSAELSCRSRQAAWRRAPEDIGWALRAGPGARVYVVQAVWAAGGQPAAHVTTYLLPRPAGPLAGASLPGAAEAGPPPAVPVSEPASATPAAEASGAAGARVPPGGAAADPGGPLRRPAAGATAAAGRSLLSLTPCPELPVARWSDPAVPDRPASLQVELQPPPPSVARRLRLSAGQPAALVTARFDDPDTGLPAALTVAVLRPELVRIAVRFARPPLPGGGEDGTPAPPDWTATGWR